MTPSAAAAPALWEDAVLAASLLAVDPLGTAGVSLRACPGPARDRWLTLVRALLPESAPVRRIPLHIGDGRLLGGLDLAATLRAGRPVAERGILVDADGGVVVLAMAERLAQSTAARLTAALDTGEVVVERDGLALRTPTRFGVVALDEGLTEDEKPPAALLDRLAFHLDLSAVAVRDLDAPVSSRADIGAARDRLAAVVAGEDGVAALCTAAMALGIASIRAPMLALRVARAAAALEARGAVAESDLALAARLVLAPRATQLPAPEPPEPEAPEPPDQEDRSDDEGADQQDPLEEVVLDAAQAAIPPGLLAQLQLAGRDRTRNAAAGRAGAVQHAMRRGRPAGVRRGEPRAGARLNVVETLRAAAPWQPLRRSAARGEAAQDRPSTRVEVHREDFRVTRYRHRSQTTSIFVVDASGSTALHRLAEAKGAVELLLADCYVRRDQVALLAFRGRTAELLLPPTRSLVRAKRSLAGLPGGGATPLATAIHAAVDLADAVRRRGETPVAVLLTDGTANVALDGGTQRAQAEEEALAAARALRASGLTALLIDTSPRPRPAAHKLAMEMDAVYLPLPHADPAAVSDAVRATADATRPAAVPVP